MEYTFKCRVDQTKQESKPQNEWQKARIQNSLKCEELTLHELLTYVTKPKSYSWSPGVFEGSVKEAMNWKSHNLFALDFDSGISLEAVLKRFADYSIFPNAYYYSFSDSPDFRRFRVILVTDQIVNNAKIRDTIISGLLSLFPESDQSCSDAGRYFYGGTTGEILSDKPVSLEAIKRICEIAIMVKDGGRTRKIGRKGVNLYNSYSNTHNLPIPSPLPNSDYSFESKSLNYLNSAKSNTFDWNKCKDNVKLFNSFLEGEWLTHTQLFGLATSLIWIKGGAKLMKSTMEKFNNLNVTKYTDNNFAIIPYVKFRSYLPQYLHDYSPYSEDHEYTNLISAVRDKRGEIEIVSRKPKLSLTEAERKFEENWNRIISADTNKIYLFKCATGLGKTRVIRNVTNALIAAPTNTLKDEIFRLMKVPAIVTPAQPVFENKQLTDKINGLYKMGLFKKAFETIKMTAEQKTADGQKAQDFLDQNSEVYHSSATKITTHERAIHNDFKLQTLIFDEDPYQTYNGVKEVTIGDVVNLTCHLRELEPLSEFLNSLEEGKIVDAPQYTINITELIDKYPEHVADGDVLGLLSSTYVCREKENIYYITHKKFSDEKKVIILSATVDEYFYTKLYGERVEVVNLENVEGMGKIIQYTAKSYSRESMKRSKKDEIKEKIGSQPTITFCEHSAYFNNQPLGIHFGNCQGYDELKGVNITVLGTPHINNAAYKLQAAILGIDTSNDKMSYKKIEWKGFRFKFMCFDDEKLREIQLKTIESHLIQAVGRARTIRTNACVKVYSNLPLFLTDEFIDELAA